MVRRRVSLLSEPDDKLQRTIQQSVTILIQKKARVAGCPAFAGHDEFNFL
jgi:hypothetical protein